MHCFDQGSVASCFLVHLPALPTAAATSRVLISHWQTGRVCLAQSWMAGDLGPSPCLLQPLFPHFDLQPGKVHVHSHVKCACLWPTAIPLLGGTVHIWNDVSTRLFNIFHTALSVRAKDWNNLNIYPQGSRYILVHLLWWESKQPQQAVKELCRDNARY